MSKKFQSIVMISILLMIGGICNLAAEEKKNSPSFTKEQKYLFDVFKTRRSVRKFKSTSVPDEHVLKILDIARSAPTAGNQQPWKFLVIRNREKLNLLKEECISSTLESVKKRGDMDENRIDSLRQRLIKNYSGYLSAPVYVVVLVDNESKYPSYNVYDGTLAAGYLLVAARSLGYGTVFITDSIPFSLIQKVFNIPQRYKGICFIPIGIPDIWPGSPPKKSLNDFIVFEEFDKDKD